eukprot:7343474-Pyramimonas_sp.AAC.1
MNAAQGVARAPAHVDAALQSDQNASVPCVVAGSAPNPSIENFGRPIAAAAVGKFAPKERGDRRCHILAAAPD